MFEVLKFTTGGVHHISNGRVDFLNRFYNITLYLLYIQFEVSLNARGVCISSNTVSFVTEVIVFDAPD